MEQSTAREVLLSKQKRLQRRVSMLAADVCQPKSTKTIDEQLHAEHIQVLLELQNETISELEQITKALHLLDCGKFGQCLDCGRPIEPERLQLSSYTRLCSRCAAEEHVVDHLSQGFELNATLKTG